MKFGTSLLFILFIFNHLLYGQSNSLPNVIEDYTINQRFTVAVNARLQVPVPLGIGVNGTFYIPNLIHIDAEMGYGWTYKIDKPQSEGKAFMPWIRAHAGWPFYIKTSTTTKFVTNFNTSEEKMYFYKIKVPSHRFIMPEVGIYINPMTKKLSDVNTVTFLTKTFSLGLAYRTLIHVKAKVKDSQSGDTYTGQIKRYGLIRAGLLVPLDDQMTIDGSTPLLKSEKGNFYVNLSVPTRGGDVAWGVGFQGLGYDNQATIYGDLIIYIQ